MGRTRHAADCQRVRSIILAATWVCNAMMPLANEPKPPTRAGQTTNGSLRNRRSHGSVQNPRAMKRTQHRDARMPPSPNKHLHRIHEEHEHQSQARITPQTSLSVGHGNCDE